MRRRLNGIAAPVNSDVMPLPFKLKRYTFPICFGISLLPFVALNVAMYVSALYCCEGDSVMEAGFPLKWYVTGWVFRGVLWNAFVVDVVLAVVASLVSAKILTSVFRPAG